MLRLVTTRAGIVSGAKELLSDDATYKDMAGRANPYGDGRAAERIVKYLESDLTGG